MTGPEAVERVARLAYGGLIARLAARTRDIAAAEDALSAALIAALERWPQDGVPDRPEAWLTTVARRRWADARRRTATVQAAESTLTLLAEAISDVAGEPRLGLMSVCAHPALDAAVRAPLMLQCVLGVPVARMAPLWLLPPATLGQRLSRAKGKIRDARMRFDLPEGPALASRAPDILDALYAAYTIGHDSPESAGDLATEALWLAEIADSAWPDHPEAAGLHALMLYGRSRAKARRQGGAFVPLDAQDPAQWDRAMIARAEARLHVAARGGAAGRYQIEAAIQSVHAGRAFGRGVDRSALAVLYLRLLDVAPGPGAVAAAAVALAGAGQGARALALLDAQGDAARDYQPFWAARAHVLQTLHAPGAQAAWARAAALAVDPAAKLWLMRQAHLDNPPPVA